MSKLKYCIFSRYRLATPLLCLRDIKSGFWNIDTIFIFVEKGKEKKLESLAKSDSWNTDEVKWLESEEAKDALGVGGGGDFSKKVLLVWCGLKLLKL